MADRITFTVVCDCGGSSRVVGRIDDQRATGGKVTVWSPTTPPRWQDRVEQTIRCAACGHPAQLSDTSAAAVSDLLAAKLDHLPSVRITDPDEHDRVIVELSLRWLSDMLGKLPRLLKDT